MPVRIDNVLLIGAGGLFGSQVLAALQNEGGFNITVLSRESSKSTFPAGIKIEKVDDDYPVDQLVSAFKGQDAVISAIPGRPYTTGMRMIDAAVQAGVKRFIPTEYGNNTCPEAAQLVKLYEDKAIVAAYLKEQSEKSPHFTWTAIHTGQFFDWGLESGWLDYYLDEKRVTIYDSGNTKWSTTTLGTASAAVVGALLNIEETKNRNLHVASFTVSQREVLAALEKATGSTWKVDTMSSADALKKSEELDDKDYSDGLKLRILMLLYADDKDRGGNFQKFGLSNDLVGLEHESLEGVIDRIVNEHR